MWKNSVLQNEDVKSSIVALVSPFLDAGRHFEEMDQRSLSSRNDWLVRHRDLPLLKGRYGLLFSESTLSQRAVSSAPPENLKGNKVYTFYESRTGPIDVERVFPVLYVLLAHMLHDKIASDLLVSTLPAGVGPTAGHRTQAGSMTQALQPAQDL